MKKLLPKNINSGGFSIIELLVSITIVAVLSVLGLITYNYSLSKTRDAQRKQDLQDIRAAVYLVQSNYGSFCSFPNNSCAWGYTANNTTYGMEGSGTPPTYASMKTLFLDTKYLRKAAHDPKAGTSWIDYYLAVIDEDNFTISARLENPPSAGELIGCTPLDSAAIPSEDYNYCIAK